MLEKGDSRPEPSRMTLYCRPEGRIVTPALSAFSLRNCSPALLVAWAMLDIDRRMKRDAANVLGAGIFVGSSACCKTAAMSSAI